MKPLVTSLDIFKRNGVIIRCKRDPHLIANQIYKLLKNNPGLNNYYMIIKNDYNIRYELPKYLILEELRKTYIDIGHTKTLENIVKKLKQKDIRYNLILSGFTNIMTNPNYIEQLQLLRHDCFLIDTTEKISEYLNNYNSRLINLPLIEVIDM